MLCEQDTLFGKLLIWDSYHENYTVIQATCIHLLTCTGIPKYEDPLHISKSIN